MSWRKDNADRHDPAELYLWDYIETQNLDYHPLPTYSIFLLSCIVAITTMFIPSQQRQIPNVDLLSWAFRNVDKFSGKPVLIDASNPRSSLTPKDVLLYVKQLIAGFKARHIGPGDHVLILAHNQIFYTALYLGIVGAGACVVGANPAYGHQELTHLMQVSKVKAVIVQPDLLDKLLPAAKACGVANDDIFLFDHDEKVSDQTLQSWKVLLQHGESDWTRFDDEKTSKATIASLMSTSGTTGLPKAATISHYAHIAQSVLLYDSKEKPYEVRRLLSLPQFHAFAAPLMHLAPLCEGHPTWIMKRYLTEPYLEYAQKYQITETAMVPPIVLDLISQDVSKQQLLKTVKYVWCAGAPLSERTQKRIYSILSPDAIFSQVWGLSEIGWITTFHYPEKDDTGSVGRLLPNMQAFLLDEDGNAILEDNKKGEIFIQGPSIMNSYLVNPTATSDTIENGWLRTGDIGYCRKGKWYICDRAKEIIKVKGWQVSPTELEDCLMTHPHVLDAAVIGIVLRKDEGEVPRAYVVLRPMAKGRPTASDLSHFVVERLAKFKALVGGVVFVESIPKAASGKVLRGKLRERAQIEIPKTINGVNGLRR